MTIQNIFYKLCILIISLGLMVIYPKAAIAGEQSLSVSPVIINITLSPGKTYTHEVTIENLSTAPMLLRTSLNDFMTGGEEGGYVFEETRSNPLLSWIKLSQTEFLLGPKEKKKLQMTITTPESIPLGGYYGILFFEPVQTNMTATTRVSSKIGVLMLANVGVTDPNAPKAEIVNFSTNIFDKDKTLPMLLRVKNISLNFFTAKPTLHISPLFSLSPLSPQSLTLEDKIIFPGQIRRWEEQLPIEGLSPNIYKAHMAVSTGNGQYLTAEKYFIIFPFAKAIIIAIILLLILFIVAKRKRFGKALKALYR